MVSPPQVSVPSQKDIEEAILRRKKQELLEKYIAADLLDDQTGAP